jgi:hypothetical protein
MAAAAADEEEDEDKCELRLPPNVGPICCCWFNCCCLSCSNAKSWSNVNLLETSPKFPKAEEDGVLGEDSRLLLLLLLPIEDDGEPGIEASDIDEVEPPTHNTFLFTVRSMALLESVANPLAAAVKLIQLLLRSRLAFELNFTCCAFLDFFR